MKKERHHMEPVSLGGRHISQNLMELDQDIHSMLHHILDINGNYYRGFVRQMRIETNHCLITKPEHIEKRSDMQKHFFSNLHKLPTWLQVEHIRKMQEQQQMDYGVYKKITNTELDKPEPRGSHKDRFMEYHRCSKEAQKETVKIVIDAVRRKFYT